MHIAEQRAGGPVATATKAEVPMFRRRTRKDSRSTRTTALTDAQGVRHMIAIGAMTLIMATVGLIIMVEAPRMQQRLSARIMAQRLTITIEWPMSAGATESWLPSVVQDELLATAYREAERRPDPLSPAALSAIAATLSETGWFQEIRRIHRQSGNTIRIEATWRTPAAVVRRGGVDYLIAEGGELLPIAYQPERAPLPALIGVAHAPPTHNGRPAYGTPWQGTDVHAGLEVLSMVNTRPWRGQVAAVDVSDYAGSRRLVLVTQWNGRAVWGGAPSDTIPGEVSAEMKLRRLDVLYRQFQRIDARRRIVEVAGPMTLVDDSASADAS
jgi:hypothetical protein